MAKKTSKKRQLVEGGTIDLGDLDVRKRAFLADLEKMKRQGVSYFEIYRAAVGPGSPALDGRSRVDRKTADSSVYLAARDIATRAGIEQGLILAPDHVETRANAPANASMISVTQAAELIGITRAAVYKAIGKHALEALRIGNVTVVNRASALRYREERREASIRRLQKTPTRSVGKARRVSQSAHA
jgi:excisionase family DNA binding protein